MFIFLSLVFAWFLVGYIGSKKVSALFEDMVKRGEYRAYARWIYTEFESRTSKKFEFSIARFSDLLPGAATFIGACHGPFTGSYLKWLEGTHSEWKKFCEEQSEKMKFYE